MTIESYAQFSIAFGFQTTIAMLTDLGFCGSIVALAGERGHDPAVVGGYIAAARHFRSRISWFVIPGAAVCFFLLMRQHGWRWEVQVALFGSIAANILAQGINSFYGAPMLIHQRLRQGYQAQSIAASARLILNGGLHFSQLLSATTASWAATAATVVNAILIRRIARPLVDEPQRADPRLRREMLQYVLPLLPGVAFTAVQGQISLFLITIFGKQGSIAEVAALGRLGQILAILVSLNSVIIAPYFAKLPQGGLWRRYQQTLFVACLIACGSIAFAFCCPEPLLWVLGPKYVHLHTEISWSIVAWGLSYVSGVMWTIHSARRWVFWWGSMTYIAVLVISQAVAIAVMDLSNTQSILYFNVIAASATLCVHIVTSFYGFHSAKSTGAGQ